MQNIRKIISALPNKTGVDGVSIQIIKSAFEIIGNRFLGVRSLPYLIPCKYL